MRSAVRWMALMLTVGCSALSSLDDLRGASDAGASGADAGLGGQTQDGSAGASGLAGASGSAGTGAGGSAGAGAGGSAGAAGSWLAGFADSYGREADQMVGELVVDPSDGVVLIGSFQGSTDVGAGKVQSKGLEDIFVVKLGATGGHSWSNYYGSVGDDLGHSVATDPTGAVYATGHFSDTVNFGGGALTAVTRDIFLLKLDADGQHVWSKSFGGGGSDTGNALLASSTHVVLAGVFKNTTDFGGPSITSNGANDIVIVKLDADGGYVWQRAFGGTGFDNVTCLSQDGAGNLYFSGWFESTMTVGADELVPVGGHDGYVAKLSPDGEPSWAKSVGSTGDDFGPLCVRANAQGDLLAVGTFAGTVDFGAGALTFSDQDVVVLRYTSDGNLVSATPYGGPGTQVGRAIVLAGQQLFVGGRYDSAFDLGGGPLPAGVDAEAFVALITDSGAHVRSAGFPAAGYQEVQAAAVDSLGRVWVAGQFEQSVDFGAGLLASLGGRDVFVARFDP